jgi:hypothetical protein
LKLRPNRPPRTLEDRSLESRPCNISGLKNTEIFFKNTEIFFTVVPRILMSSKSFIYQLMHLIKYAATPPNQSQRCILTDYFNNYNFSKAQIIHSLMMAIEPKHVGAVLM